MNISRIHILIIIIALIVGFSSYHLTKKPDGVVEQVAEVVLKTEGINIDLSADDECKNLY